ncbi:MAG: Endonuclease/Exonuclease/phosphatase family protein [Phycisphaerales bacterium]|nr:Endonuclease/Exonuclease/phosphatase family protein [Phycisphaerales bacterium]
MQCMFRGSARSAGGVALVALSISSFCQAGTITVANWNMANGPALATDSNLSTILGYMGSSGRKFDVLAMVETDTGSAPQTATAVSTVFGGTYAAVTAKADGGGDRTGFTYNTSTLQLLDTVEVDGGLTHPSLRGHFRPIGTTGADDFYMYAVHLRSGDTSAIKADRLTEAETIRADVASLNGANVILGGDFNWSGADEVTPGTISNISGAYRAFAANGTGQATDVINEVGAWRGSEAFKSLDTEDPGASMNDRFDMQLASPNLLDNTDLNYVSGSYSIVGNNGTNTLGGMITTGNGAPTNVLTALADFSDHLPVVANYSFAVPEPAIGFVLAAAVPLMRRRRASV